MTIWYDFTTTLRNTGRNGIANVEWSLGAALLDGEVRGFRLDDRDGLVAIDTERDLGSAAYAAADRIDHLPDPAALGWRHVAKSFVAAVARDHRDAAETAFNAAVMRTRGRRNALERTVRRRLPARPGSQRLDDLVGPGDVVVSMGADWEGTLARSLGRLRAASGCAVVTMVYDLIPLTHTHLAFHKDRSLFTSYYEALLAHSDHITCISAQTERDLLAFAAERGVAAPSTSVLRLGDGSAPPTPSAVDRDDFFLMVGTVERRKNVELVYDALRMLGDGEPLPDVVIAGGAGWGVDDLLREIGLRSTAAARSIVLLGTVDDDVLDGLYRRTRALLFPSHYEGWGLPLREAAVRGTPIASGEGGAQREAIGDYDGAIFLPTDDPAPWADYLRSRPTPVEPSPFVPWSVPASQLSEAMDAAMRSRST